MPARATASSGDMTMMYKSIPRSVARRLRRSRAAGVAAVLTCVAVMVLAAVFGAALRDWAVGLGMDNERAALIAALLEVAGGAAIVTLLSARTGASRLGAVVAMVIVEVVPFLDRARHTATPPGLTARTDVAGWVTLPLAMLFLGLVAACLGAGIGLLLNRDLRRCWRALRARPLMWMLPAPALALAAVVSAGALTAVQTGPISALYSYNFQPPAAVAAVPTPSHTPAVAATTTAIPTPTPSAFVAGHQDKLTVDGRSVLVYVPGGRASDGTRRLQVLYLLHGYPSNPNAAINGLQVGGVIDQLVATNQLYPTLIVVPDGNGTASSDAEWGDNPDGDTVETWLTTRVIPAIDAHYPTFGATFRGIAGYSAGGFGAVNLAFRHPDLFNWAASWSGYFIARGDIFGSSAAANSPTQTVGQLSTSQRMPVYIGAGADDRMFLDASIRFREQLVSLSWPQLQSDIVPGGHGIEAWRDQMVRSLTWLEMVWNPCAHRLQAESRCEVPYHG